MRIICDATKRQLLDICLTTKRARLTIQGTLSAHHFVEIIPQHGDDLIVRFRFTLLGLGASLADFFRFVGIELHPTKNECEFTTRKQDDAVAES